MEQTTASDAEERPVPADGGRPGNPGRHGVEAPAHVRAVPQVEPGPEKMPDLSAERQVHAHMPQNDQARAPAPEKVDPRRNAPAPPGDVGSPRVRRGHALFRFGAKAVKTIAILSVIVAALLAAAIIWDYYITSPWTRDGRVRVQVASVAPQVSGQITDLRIIDNQYVRKGDVLYVIDPFDFQISLASAKTQVQMKAADLQVKYVQADRRQHLSNLATTPEEQQQYAGNATQAKAAFDAAQQQQAQAEINLKRTEVRSPVNGYITNLLMRVGDYAKEGTTNVSIIDADSYWVDGYFEETKMAHVCIGDRAEAQLMGYTAPIVGRVQTVTRGISVSDAAPSTQGLPNVDPVYTWVRLAQRVPVRIAIASVPPGVPLVSGMTATVTIREPKPADTGPWWQLYTARLQARTKELFDRPAPRHDCIPTIGSAQGTSATLSMPEPLPWLRPDQINPGLTPGMTQSPQKH